MPTFVNVTSPPSSEIDGLREPVACVSSASPSLTLTRVVVPATSPRTYTSSVPLVSLPAPSRFVASLTNATRAPFPESAGVVDWSSPNAPPAPFSRLARSVTFGATGAAARLRTAMSFSPLPSPLSCSLVVSNAMTVPSSESEVREATPLSAAVPAPVSREASS